MKNLISQFGLILICGLALTTSCTTVKYLYGGRQYSSAEDALSAQRQAEAALIAQLSPVAQPLNVTLAVIIPADDYIAANWVTRRKMIGDEQVDYLIKSFKSGILTHVEAIKKRRLFDAVAFRQSATPEQEAFSEQLGLVLTATKNPEWRLKAKGQSANNAYPVETPASSMSPIQQMTFWLDNVEAAARKAK